SQCPVRSQNCTFADNSDQIAMPIECGPSMAVSTRRDRLQSPLDSFEVELRKPTPSVVVSIAHQPLAILQDRPTGEHDRLFPRVYLRFEQRMRNEPRNLERRPRRKSVDAEGVVAEWLKAGSVEPMVVFIADPHRRSSAAQEPIIPGQRWLRPANLIGM